MKTPAVISALTVVGSIAFAAGQSQTVRVIPVDEKPLEGEMPPMMAMGAGSCDLTALPDANWFAPNLRAVVRCSVGTMGGTPNALWTLALNADICQVDVNADGVGEFFRLFGTNQSSVIPVIASGQTVAGAMLVRGEISMTNQSPVESLTSVLRREAVAEAILRLSPSAIESASVTQLRWRDMDSDGDLDLLVNVGPALPPPFGGVVWLENIGYEKPDPPLAADINQDGAVNGDDLGLLLAAWTLP